MVSARVLLVCMLGAAYAKPDTSKEDVVYTLNDDGSVDKKHACVFPFYHKGKKYTECTKVDAVHANAFWCATSTNFQELEKGDWGFCLGLRYMNNGPNPRDYATCSMNGWGDVTTVTFDDSNLVFNSIDKCKLNLVDTKSKFGKDDRYTGFQVIAFTAPDNQKSYVHRIDVRVFDRDTRSWIDLSVRRKKDHGQVVINGKPVEDEDLEKGHYSPANHKTLHVGYRKSLKTIVLDIDNQARVMYRFEGGKDRHHVNVLLFDKFYERELTGMCGNANGNPRDDYFTLLGNRFVNQRELINTWQLGPCEEVDED